MLRSNTIIRKLRHWPGNVVHGSKSAKYVVGNVVTNNQFCTGIFVFCNATNSQNWSSKLRWCHFNNTLRN